MGSMTLNQPVLASKFAPLEKLPAISRWDALTVYVADVNNSPEQYLKTVDYITTSTATTAMALLVNTDQLLTSAKEAFWPKYRLIRDSVKGGIAAQVHNSVRAEELSGFPPEYPSHWMMVSRGAGEDFRTVIGVIVAKDDDDKEVEDAVTSIDTHMDACVKVARGKYGPDVEIIIYVNKQVTLSTDIKDLTTALQTDSFSVFSSSSRLSSRVPYEGGVVLSSPATGCSLCNAPFTREEPRELHIKTVAHNRNYLYTMYDRNRSQLLQTPHPHGLDLSIQNSGDTGVGIVDNGVVEVRAKPGETKTFKIVLKNSLPSGHEELMENSGLVVEDIGVLKADPNITLTDEHHLCENEETKIRLKPGKKYKVSVTFKAPAEIGQSVVPVMVAFYHEAKSEVVNDCHKLSRMALELWFKTQNDDVESLRPAAPFVARESSYIWKARETVRGLPLTKLQDEDGLEVKLQVGLNFLSDKRKRVIKSRLETCGPNKDEQLEYKKCKDLMKAGLTAENYSDYWEFLLHCERYQEERDVRNFDLTDVVFTIDRNSGLFVLQVPGLAENRPSVLKGDKIYAKEHRDLSGRVEYEGVVHMVSGNNVQLGFSNKLVERVRTGVTWDIRFSFSPFTYDNMHRAVKLSSQFPKLLFPSAAYIPTTSEDVIINAFDERVANNPEQLAAVTAIVSQTSGPVPYLVFGPPGTGKTVTLVEAIKQVYTLYPDTHILACAPSNTAADLITKRLAGHVQSHDLYRLCAYSRPFKDVPDVIKGVTNVTSGGYVFPSMSELSKYKVLVTTLVTAGKLCSAVFPRDHFKYVFIDEAGQATEPETCIALGGVMAEGGHLVMAGDPYQLGPIVRSSLAHKHGLATSLLERLMSSQPYTNKETGGFDKRCVMKLVRNFRSHPALLELPGRLFYASELQPCADPGLVNTCLTFPGLTEAGQGTTPILFDGVIGQDCREAGSPSFFNPEEIFNVVDYVKRLREHGIDEDDIGVITPYRRQVEKLKWRLGERGMGDISVATTEEYQGQERKVIILSTVRSNPEYVSLDQKHRLGFLADSKRFNVAITRSQALLIVIGNPHILIQDKDWRELLEHCKKLDCYKGCKYPEKDVALGRMETKFGSLLMDDETENERLRVEEQTVLRKDNE